MTKNLSSHAIALFIAAHQTDVVSDEERQTYLRDFASVRHFTIVGFIATEIAKLSSGIRHAIALCAANHASHIIIDELGTLSLPSKDLVDVLGMLCLGKVELIFAKDNISLDGETLQAFHRLLTLGLVADNEVRSQRIKKSLMIKKRKGRVLGGRPFGSTTSESYVINQILDLRARGISLQIICDMLDQNGIKTIHNKKWHPTTVKRILERAKPKK